MKPLASKRAKALAIPQRVKKKVAERDAIDGCLCCIICGEPGGLPEAHYIPRSRGGLGIEENLGTLCRRCHMQYDQGLKEEREQIRTLFRAHLELCYPGWTEENLYYKKERD